MALGRCSDAANWVFLPGSRARYSVRVHFLIFICERSLPVVIRPSWDIFRDVL